MENLISVSMWIASDVLLPILVTVITLQIAKYNDRKDLLPKLLLHWGDMGTGTNPEPENYTVKNHITSLHGYYKFQRELDTELSDFLRMNGYILDGIPQHIFELILNAYRTGSYNDPPSGILYYPTAEVNDIIRRFKTNPEFIHKLKTYEAYFKTSRWLIKIVNSGSTIAYNMKIQMFNENNSGGWFVGGNLCPNEERPVEIFYFDRAYKISSSSNSEYYSGSWNGNLRTNFYLVEKLKYNKHDERLFNISYNDKFGKHHDIYCCGRIKELKNAHNAD